MNNVNEIGNNLPLLEDGHMPNVQDAGDGEAVR
jgi:hypothetical protein